MKEVALKYSTDSEAWNRQKQKLLEKEKLVSVVLLKSNPSNNRDY